jgi:hypothetical protein
VIVGIAFGGGAVIVLFADVEFASDNRLHAMLVCGIDEMHGAKDIAVIGHCDSGHSQLAHMFAEFFDVTGAVKQGIVGVQVQVDELGHGSMASLNHARTRRDVDACAF